MKRKYFGKLPEFCKTISTPCWVYATLTVASVVCIYLSNFIASDCNLKDLLFNIGCGLIASIVVALLIDVGATRLQNEKNAEIFERINGELKKKCEELPVELNTAVHECCGYDIQGKYTFDEWLCRLFDNSLPDICEEKKRLDEIDYFLHFIFELEQISNQLQRDAKYRYDNECFDENYEKQIRTLSKRCGTVRIEYRRENLNKCKDAISNEVIPAIKVLFADIANEFCRKYDADDYAD